jgi:hypothetical protein
MMTIAARLTALERAAAAATVPRCPDPFHRHIDYREVIRAICPPDQDLPPAPRCPTCAGERLAGLPVQIVAVDYADAVAGVARSSGRQEQPR